jgi:ABC-2 type transport system permease protein
VTAVVAAAPAARTPGALAGTLAVARAELAKLAARLTFRAAAGLCVVGPFLAAVVLRAQSSAPEDTLFGRWIHTSGFALPLVLLSFCGQWALPALAGLGGGDIFSAEDAAGTWSAVLTRSCSRAQLWAGKVLAALSWAVVVVVLLGLASTAAGLFLGQQPLVDLSGVPQPAATSLPRVLASWATALAPTLALTCVGMLLSVLTRRSVVGVAGPLLLALGMQLVALVDGPPAVRALLLSPAYGAWHGLWVDPSFTGPIVRATVVSVAWGVLATGAALLVFLRRDVAV